MALVFSVSAGCDVMEGYGGVFIFFEKWQVA